MKQRNQKRYDVSFKARVVGRIPLDTNLAEQELRREKVGAKNWLYCGIDDGAHWNAVVVSLVASCQLHGIEPWAYLRDVLTPRKLPQLLDLWDYAVHGTDTSVFYSSL